MLARGLGTRHDLFVDLRRCGRSRRTTSRARAAGLIDGGDGLRRKGGFVRVVWCDLPKVNELTETHAGW